jgi:peptidoglycan/LPS O-acetylase OafA/YrhL
MLGSEWYTWFAADGLAAGSVLALVLRTPLSRKQGTLGAALLLTISPLLLMAGAPFGMLSRQTILGASLQLTLVNIFFAGLLLFFLVLGSGHRKWLVYSASLEFFGYISYGLYLIHPMLFRIYDRITRISWPELQPSLGHFDLIVLRFVLVSVVAIGLSYISRRYYEEWFLQLKDRVAPQPAEAPVNVVVLPQPSTSVAAAEASESVYLK